MVASPAKGWKTAVDYAKAAKANLGKLTYASTGVGSGTHMNAEKFKFSAGIDPLHVPYRGTPEALAAGSEKRSSVLPDVPTTKEQGFKNSAYDFWRGLFAPASTPPAVIAPLNAEGRKALESPDVNERLSALGTDIAPSTPADFDKKVARELVENAELVKKAGIKIQ